MKHLSCCALQRGVDLWPSQNCSLLGRGISLRHWGTRGQLLETKGLVEWGSRGHSGGCYHLLHPRLGSRAVPPPASWETVHPPG